MNQHFHQNIDSNRQIFTNNLPDITNVESEKIGIRLWQKMRLLHLIWFFILLVTGISVCLFIGIFEKYSLYILSGIILFILIFSLLGYLKYLSWRSMAYSLRENDLSFERGWFWNSKVIVPFNRIQHVTVVETALDKLFKIAQLNIFTAGGHSSDLTIQGLDPDAALKIRDFVLRKTTVEDEEE